MSDEFLRDEQELIEQQEKGRSVGEASRGTDISAARAKSASRVSGHSDARRQAPPFWMVLVIAAIALLLGVIIGYLIGTSTAYSLLGQTSNDEMQQRYAADGGQDVSGALPQGHPKVQVDKDGKATLANGDDSDASAGSGSDAPAPAEQ